MSPLVASHQTNADAEIDLSAVLNIFLFGGVVVVSVTYYVKCVFIESFRVTNAWKQVSLNWPLMLNIISNKKKTFLDGFLKHQKVTILITMWF